MFYKYFIFNLIFINSHISVNNFENEILQTIKNRQEDYEKFFSSYLQHFKKLPETLEEEKQSIIFIRKFAIEYMKKYKLKDQILFINRLQSSVKELKYEEKYIKYKPIDGSINEILYKVKKYNKIYIKYEACQIPLYELLDGKNYSKQDKLLNKIPNMIREHYNLFNKKTTPLILINRNIILSHIPVSLQDKPIASMKNNEIFEFFINEFINSGAFEEKYKTHIHKFIWSFVDFIYYIYFKYEFHLNKNNHTFEETVGLANEIINFTNEYNQINKDLPPLKYEDLYRFFKNLYMPIEKINDVYYMYSFINHNTIKLNKIKNLDGFYKLFIIKNLLRGFQNPKIFAEKTNYKKFHLVEKKYKILLESLVEKSEFQYF